MVSETRSLVCSATDLELLSVSVFVSISENSDPVFQFIRAVHWTLKTSVETSVRIVWNRSKTHR